MNQTRDHRILDILNKSLTIDTIELVNDSHKHHGHAGSDGSGQTHYHLSICAKELEGKSRVEQHKLIFSLLKDELDSGLHALQLTILSGKKG